MRVLLRCCESSWLGSKEGHYTPYKIDPDRINGRERERAGYYGILPISPLSALQYLWFTDSIWT